MLSLNIQKDIVLESSDILLYKDDLTYNQFGFYGFVGIFMHWAVPLDIRSYRYYEISTIDSDKPWCCWEVRCTPSEKHSLVISIV